LNLSLSTGSLDIYPLRTILRMARQAGLDGVEIGINAEAIVRGGHAVRGLVEGEGLALFSVHPALMSIPGWREKRDGLGRTLGFAQEAGAGVLVIHTPRSPTLEADSGLAFCREIERWQAELAGGGLRLAIENKALLLPADRDLALTPLDRLRDFAEHYDLGLVLDTTHAGSAGEDILAARRLMGERLANVHLSDLGGAAVPRHRWPGQPLLRSVFQQHRFPGTGRLPLAELLAELARHGYTGPVTLEVSPIGLRVWWPPAVRRRLAQAVAWMRRAAV
jgi:sugar phosphate isomerase/epimerase